MNRIGIAAALAAALLTAGLTTLTASRAPAAAPAAADTGYATAFAAPARFWTLRLRPGQDVRAELARFAAARGIGAAFVASCAGSCTRTAIRYANQPDASVRTGHFEIVSLTGTLAKGGMHVHASFADSTGATFGGHLMDGTIVYTTAEIVIGEIPGARYEREVDPTYGWRELAVKRK